MSRRMCARPQRHGWGTASHRCNPFMPGASGRSISTLRCALKGEADKGSKTDVTELLAWHGGRLISLRIDLFREPGQSFPKPVPAGHVIDTQLSTGERVVVRLKQGARQHAQSDAVRAVRSPRENLALIQQILRSFHTL